MPWSTAVRRDLCVAAIAGALGAALYPGAVFRGESFFERDLHLDWYPRLEAIARCLRPGVWPLWDQTIGFGQPLLADPGAQVLYPVTWLALLVPQPAAYTVFVFVHLVLAAVGTARLARRLGAGSLGAPVAAGLFVLSGPFQSSVNLWHHFAGLSWMPWVLLGVDRVARHPRGRPVLALAAAASLQILAGSADVCAMTLALAVALAGLRLRGPLHRRAARVVAGLGGAALLAAAVTAALWWPAAELVSRSPRRELPADIRGAWSLPVTGLARLVLSLDPEHVPFDADAWLRLYDRPSPPFLSSVDLGLPMLCLAALALCRRRLRTRALVLAGMAILGVLLALGPHGPLYPLAAETVPILKVFRYPTKALLGVALVVALLAGLGTGALARGRLSRRVGLALALTVVPALVLAVAFALRVRAASFAASAICAALAALALALWSRSRLGAVAAAVVVASVAGADLLAAHLRLNATVSASLLFAPPRATAAVDRREGRRLYVYDYHSLPGVAERLLGRSDAYTLSAAPAPGRSRQAHMAAVRLYLAPPSAGLFGIEGSYDMDLRGLYPRPLNDLVFFLRRVEGTPVHTRLLRMGAVGTVLSLHRQGLDDLRLDEELPSLFPEPILVWRVPSPLPRARVVGGVRVGDGEEAFAALLDSSFDPEEEVLLPEGTPRFAPAGFVGRCRLLRRTADRIALEAEAAFPAHVVVADAFDAGWTATVDGREAPVRRANVAFLAVQVPPGRHVVEMVYRPRSALRGGVVSTLAAGVLLLMLAATRRRRTRSTQTLRSTDTQAP